MGRQSPRQSLAFAAATGLASIVPIGRAPRGVKVALVAGTGATAAAATFVALRRPDMIAADRDPVPVPPSVGVGVGVGAIAAGATAAGIALDRVFEQALVRRGVPYPRVVLGAAGAVLSYALDVVDRRFDTPD